MSNGFSDFADAMARSSSAPSVAAHSIERVAVLGGGADAQLLAALCLSQGRTVRLFSAYGAELNSLKSAGGINLRDDGPVGSYQVNAESGVSIECAAELDLAVSDADLIFLTGPVHKQRTYAMVLADHLKDGQILVLAPARTFGGLETRAYLNAGGCCADVTIAELSTLPFWFRQSGNTLHLSRCAAIDLTTVPANRLNVQSAVRDLLGAGNDHAHGLHCALGDASGLVEVPTLLMGGPAFAPGGPVVPMGGAPLEKNATFRNLLGHDHLTMIDALAQERRAVARQLGIRDLPPTEQWLDQFAGHASGAGARPVPDREQSLQMVRDAVVGSLVPLAAMARALGVDCSTTDAMITSASTILNADLTAVGRNLSTLGVGGLQGQELRNAVEQLSAGGR